MKKFFVLFALLFVSLAGMSQNNSDNGLIGRARGALRGCVSADAQASVSVNGSCFAGGFLTTVTFATYIPCPTPNCVEIDGVIECYPCDPVFEVQGYVTFGCEGEILEVVCTH